MLTVLEALNAKPKAKPYKILDGKGLYLCISPAGGKAWRYRYELPIGKAKTFTIGTFPEIGLEDARKERVALREMVKVKIDPVQARRAERQAREAAKVLEITAKAIEAATEAGMAALEAAKEAAAAGAAALEAATAAKEAITAAKAAAKAAQVAEAAAKTALM